MKNWSISWNLPINDAKCAHMSLGGTSANRSIIHDGTKASDIPTARPQERSGCLDRIQLLFQTSSLSGCKEGLWSSQYVRKDLSRIRHDDFEQLYATYVRPLLEYASSVVHTGLQTDILCLERVERTATRLVRGIRTYPYCERLLLLNFSS